MSSKNFILNLIFILVHLIQFQWKYLIKLLLEYETFNRCVFFVNGKSLIFKITPF